MTTAADESAGEQAFENAFEALLAGRAVPAEGADLAAFAGAVRTSATVPGRPNAALAELLATGLLVDLPPLSARTAKRRRRPMWFFTAILAKIASAGAVAQAATGAGIVLVGFTGLGAAGALPTPVQHTFSTVVSAISPAGTDDTQTPVTTTAPSTTSESDATSESAEPTASESSSSAVAGDTAATTSAPANFGQRVSEQAHNGGVDGQTVSSWAHERNAARKSGATSRGGDATDAEKTDAQETEAPETEAPETEAPEKAPESDGDSSDSDSSDTSDSSDGGHGTSGGHSHD
jgi:hypothetical protein